MFLQQAACGTPQNCSVPRGTLVQLPQDSRQNRNSLRVTVPSGTDVVPGAPRNPRQHGGAIEMHVDKGSLLRIGSAPGSVPLELPMGSMMVISSAGNWQTLDDISSYHSENDSVGMLAKLAVNWASRQLSRVTIPPKSILLLPPSTALASQSEYQMTTVTGRVTQLPAGSGVQGASTSVHPEACSGLHTSGMVESSAIFTVIGTANATLEIPTGTIILLGNYIQKNKGKNWPKKQKGKSRRNE